MFDITKDEIVESVKEEKVYVGTVIPWYISFIIYMMIGVPIL